ncbi:hypothetical protein PS2_033961 [Malus domestica]
MIPHYWKQPLRDEAILQDTIKIHQLNTADMAYNLQNTKDNHFADMSIVGTDTALQNKELHHPSNDKHICDLSDHNYFTLVMISTFVTCLTITTKSLNLLDQHW